MKTVVNNQGAAQDGAHRPKQRPIISGLYRPGQDKQDIALWPNAAKNIDDAAYEKLDENGRVQLSRMRDLMGYVTITRGVKEHSLAVSGWIHEEDGQAPRIKIMSDRNSGNEWIGSIKAMTKYHGRDARGDYGLRLIGDLDIAMEPGAPKEKITVTGQVNGTFQDRALIVDASRVFGFPDRMIEEFTRKIDIRLAQRAMDAAQAGSTEPSMAPA